MSPPNTLPAANDDALAEQARGWIAWLASGDIGEGRMHEFERWLAQPGHRAPSNTSVRCGAVSGRARRPHRSNDVDRGGCAGQ